MLICRIISSGLVCVLVSLLATHHVDAEEKAGWKIGVAKTAITPEKSMWMAGYAARNAPADGKLTELWCKAMVLEDGQGHRGLILTLDLIGIGRILAGEVCEHLEKSHKFARRNISICTSHTHSGPVVGKNLGPLHYLLVDQDQRQLLQDYTDGLPKKIEAVVSEALGSMGPARLQWGSGKATFAVNRRNNKPYDQVPARRARGDLAGPVDHDVPVLSVRDSDGQVKAILFGYACHATVLDSQQWCGDYPGYAQMALEKNHPGCVALFWAGCGGDQNPLPRRSPELARAYGDELAESVDEVLAAPMPDLKPELRTGFQIIELPLSDVPTIDELHETTKSPNRFEVARARMLLRQIEKDGGLQGHYPYPIGVWKFGEQIEFITLGGETVVDYALRLKRKRRGTHTWVAGYSNDVMAYIPSRRVLKEGGYEGGGSNVYYGLPALWDETIEEVIAGAVVTIGASAK